MKTDYICDKKFHLDHILEMYKEETTFGLVFITGKLYNMYKVVKTGNYYETIKVEGSTTRLPKKQKKGGQSAPRFQRLRDEAIEAYIKKVSEVIIKTFMYENNTKCKINKLIISGPSTKKTLLIETPLIKQYFNRKNNNEPIIINCEYDNDINSIKHLFDENVQQCEDDTIKYIQTLLATADERMLFGIDEINREHVSEIITDNETIKLLNISDKTVVKIISKERLDRIGIKCIGIKYF